MKYVVCDIDGVLARPNPERMKLIGALPDGGTDWDAFYATDFSKDERIEVGNDLLERIWVCPLVSDVVFLTSRSECVKGQTAEWLFRLGQWGCEAGRLLMRADGDERPASEVKLDLLSENGLTPENVFCVIDDEAENIDAFAKAGFTTLLFKEGRV